LVFPCACRTCKQPSFDQGWPAPAFFLGSHLASLCVRQALFMTFL
jgi:hypothetical protein